MICPSSLSLSFFAVCADKNLSCSSTIRRLARAEVELIAERVKVAMLRRLDDVKRMLSPPDAKPRHRW